MSKELITNEWYQELVEDCKSIITEAVFTSRWALVKGYWTLGERIREDCPRHKKGEHYQGKLDELLSDLRVKLDKSDATLWRAVAVYDKYQTLGEIPDGKNITWNKLITKYLPEPKKEKTPELPKGKYQVIYADPPWDYGNSQFMQKEKGEAGKITSSSELHYPVMSIDEIKKLPIEDISTENCLLFMWTSSPHLEFAIQIINAWGFEYKTIAFVWDKQKLNPSAYTMSQIEICLVGKKGNIPEPRGSRNTRQFLSEERKKHSQKPQEIRKRIEKMFPTQKKIELFGTRKIEGWDIWGNMKYE